MILEKQNEIIALERFRSTFPDFFRKNDRRLFLHLGILFTLLCVSITVVVTTPHVGLKIFLGIVNSFLLFSFVNATIHHHHTHHNAAQGPLAKKLLDLIYLTAIPNAPKRRSRYVRAHLNHHARPFHETDVDHHYGKDRYLAMRKSVWTRLLYFLELTFVGAHMPGWEDDRYMNQVPLEDWNRAGYEEVKKIERKKAVRLALFQWGLFIVSLWVLPAVAWGWAFPMLFVKNWAHYLGQFQHYDNEFLDPNRSSLARTKTYRFPGWLNYLAGGEISGHFLHHLFPEMPYYQVESARKKFVKDPELSKLFVTYGIPSKSAGFRINV